MAERVPRLPSLKPGLDTRDSLSRDLLLRTQGVRLGGIEASRPDHFPAVAQIKQTHRDAEARLHLLHRTFHHTIQFRVLKQPGPSCIGY